MVVQCVFWATVIAVGVAVLVYKSPAGSSVANAVSAIGLTIPSFALLGLLIAPLGLGIGPSVIALAFYAALPILRNAIVGLAGVDSTLIESAKGMGMGKLRTLLRVELPVAWPVILAGVRVSTQLVMGIGAIAAYVSGPGLGGLIFSGLSRLGGVNAVNEALSATLLIVILALLLDLLLLLVGRLTISRGIRV
ncbi:MAG: ABC transporter permease subunit [Streptosporangiales bacterium]|nr:ABC transporter permease subunit [Streptosporangiales bacterium]